MRSSDDGELGWLLRDLAHAPVASSASVPDVAFSDEGVAITSAPPRLTAGVLLGGRFAIVELLGRGGMGEVYRAHDRRLDRDVAIKLLTDGDEDRRSRFEVEARAASAVHHDNVLAIHDVSAHEGVPFLVLELVDGITLRARLAQGGLPVPRAIAIGVQICEGLAAAHAAGVIHRDLKPENLVLARGSERVKIVDFGLAKRAASEDASLTVDGALLGTVAYMSPEQARGDEIDARSDLFAVGAILVEMITARPAFRGATNADTLSAILRDEPALDGVPDDVARIVRRCLAKSRAHRFQSALDLAFALAQLGGEAPRARRALPRYAPLALGVGIALAGGAGLLAMRSRSTAPAALHEPTFARLSFGRGMVQTARYAPDAKTVVYSAAWEGAPPQVFTTEAGVFESRALGIDAELVAISSGRELLLKQDIARRSVWGFWSSGRLSRAPLHGGAPRELATDVSDADIAADGTLAIVRTTPGLWTLEWPLGRVVYRTTGWIGQPRISPDGTRLAFLAHPRPEDDGGTVDTIDASGAHAIVTRDAFLSVQGLAWSPDGREIWFTGTRIGATRELRAVAPTGGAERLVYRAPTTLRLLDAARDGRLLVARDDNRVRMTAVGQDGSERDLAWLDGSCVTSFSGDDKTISFTESWDGAGARYGAYVRSFDGGPAVRVGDGNTSALSWRSPTQILMTQDDASRDRPRTLWRQPIGAGAPTKIDIGDLDVHWVRWFPDDASVLLVLGDNELARARIDGSAVERLGVHVSDIFNIAIDPSGDRIGIVVDGTTSILDLATRRVTRVNAARPNERPAQFSHDGTTLAVIDVGEVPATYTTIDLMTGTRTSRSIAPRDRAGASAITSVVVSHDLSKIVYSYLQTLSTVYEASL